MASGIFKFTGNKNGHCQLCNDSDDKGPMIGCDDCQHWFHQHCAEVKTLPLKSEKWFCPRCKEIKNKIGESQFSATAMNQMMELQKQAFEYIVRQQAASQKEALTAITSTFKETFQIRPEGNLMVMDTSTTANNSAGDETVRQLNKIMKRQALMELPDFDGSYKTWPKFSSIFEATTKEGEFDHIENLNRLTKHLKGKALKMVEPLMMDHKNVPTIIKNLKEQFGNVRFIYEGYLKDVIYLKNPKMDMPETMISFIIAIENLVANIKLINQPAYLKDPRLVEDLTMKLPFNMRRQWLQHLIEKENQGTTENPYEIPDLEDLSEWLKDHKILATRMMSQKKAEISDTFRTTYKKEHLNAHLGTTARKFKCYSCNKTDHKMTECPVFKRMGIHKRKEIVTKNKVCFSCCNFSNHFAKDCKFRKICNTNGCKQHHHAMLHEGKNPAGSSREDQCQKDVDQINYHKKNQKTSNIFYQIIPVTLSSGDKKVKVLAFLDHGSSTSLLLDDVRKELNINGTKKPLALSWTNGEIQKDENSREITVSIEGYDKKPYVLHGIRTIANIALPSQSLNRDELVEEYPHLKETGIESYGCGTPKLLLGLPHSFVMQGLDSIAGKFNQPIANRTRLGWVLHGKRENGPSNMNYTVAMINEVEEGERSINKLMNDFFSVEGFGVKVPIKPLVSSQIERAEKIMKDTLRYENGQYEIGLLWKQDQVVFPNSYLAAMTRLKGQERKMVKEPGLRTWYNDKIKEYVTKGYIRKLSKDETEKQSSKTFHIPHFSVTNPNKLPLKPRLVFDAAAKCNGQSLNSNLLSGPDTNSNLLGVLMRFREGFFAISGDIQEMFHQIKIRSEDQESQRFLFRKSETKDIDTYIIQVMTFGATCSPACAQFVKNENALKFKQKYPKEVQAIIKNHYVDDYLDSFDSLSESKLIVNNVIMIHDKAHFNIRNFVSNSPELLNCIPAAKRMEGKVIKLGDNEQLFEKVLGVFWDTISDTINFKVKIPDASYTPTKREVLSTIMKVYDPLGLLSNITIRGKMLMQELWKLGIEWEQPIPKNLREIWNDWIKTLNSTREIQIPRCYSKFNNIKRRELHVFVDASNKAYAAVAYLRTVKQHPEKTNQEMFEMNLVAAKARVAPNKLLSIPRLELLAAVLGARLSETIERELRLKLDKIIFWTDSKTVLAWIQSDARSYNIFVGLRISEILETSTVSQWRWVDSKNNPADEATKPIENNSIWMHGPNFLHLPEENWVMKGKKFNTDEELKPVHIIRECVIPDFSYINIDWCSDWIRLKRTIGLISKRFNFKSNINSFERTLVKEDFDKAEKVLLKKAQWDTYPCEMKSLTLNRIMPTNSSLRGLTPFLDESGVMRSRGRLEHAEILSYSARFPIILPKDHHVSRLILKYYHEKFYHLKLDASIASVRQKYWIIDIRAAMKKIKSSCQMCKNRNAQPQPPIMAPIPSIRTIPLIKPFTYTGVDYFGPVNVSIGRRVEKRWGVVFTCLVTRATYLDLSRNLSTDAFFICLKNIQARRGRILHLYSDNGTNFIGANNELKRIRHRLASEGIEWFFNPPSAPHFGGAWERMVKEVKSILPSVQETMPEDVLRGLLAEIEFIINSRPLTHIPLDADDDEILTPFHFLINCAGDMEPRLDDISDGEALRDQWKRSGQLGTSYWKRWIKEYLPSLTKRSKWVQETKPIQVGDIAVTPDEDKKGKWLKVLVTDIRPSKDGVVRSARIKTAEGKYLIRPVVKLAILDVKGNTSCNGEKQNSEIKQDNPADTPKKKNYLFTASHKLHLMFIALLYLLSLAVGEGIPPGIIAYDCANPDVNLTTYSLLDVASCVPPSKNITTTEIKIQVLQKNQRGTTQVFQCKVIIKRSIKHCGMHSHTSDYEHDYSYIVKDFKSEECKMAHLFGSVDIFYDQKITELNRNATTRGKVLVVGKVSGSSCSGGTYRTSFYTWTNALVYYEFEIGLYDYIATVDYENDLIRLRNGLECPFSHGRLLDSEDGYLTWENSLNKRCEETEFEVIYEGLVNKTIDGSAVMSRGYNAIYSTVSSTHIFSIKTKEKTKICNHEGYSTDHPRILILEEVGFKSPFNRKTSDKNYDVFTYFNSKITLVESYIGQRLSEVYNSIMNEICKIDKDLMETKLTLARLNPTEFVTSIIKRSGYTAVVAGEVLHILECKPVYVTIRATERCFQEVPVFFNNRSMFLTPVTRIIQKRGIEIDCTPLLPAKFSFGGRWYTTDGRLRETTAPNKLTTDIVTDWTYTSLPNLMESGVYDSESIEKMRNMIYEQGDRKVASTILHKVLSGQNPSHQGFSFDSLVSENVIEGVLNKYWEKFISWSNWIGQITSTSIGIYFIAKIIKFAIDTIVHARILYEIYGFGWQLLASIWDSLTNLMTHKNVIYNERTKKTTIKDEEEPSELKKNQEERPQQPNKILYPRI